MEELLILSLQAVNFAYAAQLIAIVGSGFLAISITRYLGATRQNTWPSSLLNIMAVCFTLPVAQAADYWGRKIFIVAGNLSGCVGAIIVSRAPNLAVLYLGFCLIGVAHASLSLLHSVVSEVLPRKYRPFAQASVTVSASVGAILGLVMGGQLVRYGNLGNYRIYFYVVAAVFALAILGCFFGYNPPRRELQATPLKKKLLALDWVGYFLVCPGVVLFEVSLSWSQNPYPWDSAHVLAPLLIGISLLIAFVIYEWKFKTDGMLNHALWTSRNLGLSMGIIFVEGFVFFAGNQYLGYQASIFNGYDPLLSGLHFSVLLAISLFLALLIGAYSSKMKSLRWPITVGFGLVLIFTIMMSTANPNTPPSALWCYPLLAGSGFGFVVPLIMVAGQLTTPWHLISLTSGLLIATRSLGGAVALAVSKPALNSALSTHLGPSVAAAALPLGLPESSLGMLIGALTARDNNLLAHVPGLTDEIRQAAWRAVQESFSIGFRNIWLVNVAAAALAVLGKTFLTAQTTVSQSSNNVQHVSSSSINPKNSQTISMPLPISRSWSCRQKRRSLSKSRTSQRNETGKKGRHSRV